jgi:ADP-heptose:LPS heptosyltransferase
MPDAWTVFDRFTPRAAAERYRLTIEAAGTGICKPVYKFVLKDPGKGVPRLKSLGWKQDILVAINPAGAFATRNWELTNYVAFARLWLHKFPDSRFITLGTSMIREKSAFLKRELGDMLYNLTGETTPSEAFSLLQRVSLVLSEDSGLMHMAWCSGIPTLALFGSTRSDWARPLGNHSSYLDSSDLPCGNCMTEVCKFGDVHCLTRYTPEQVFDQALSLLRRLGK